MHIQPPGAMTGSRRAGVLQARLADVAYYERFFSS